ncbi:SAM-dependent methyltransferase [Sedimentitalea sp. CY04]|uniref:SAM-dependent methyltransferase n=1 Tax=Parasedimentitalea denitrificans TaxID=2211118 RepID=A0ABX0WB78_9RHOB|nr:RsmB/NOP family class I SAM-dependent RNA methyltransferase [Sedimentitalea sp. CY04]NIZ62777.1 SAM-dependent methyltransferase [Sedimentitalea sp. CY04]
MTPAARLQAAIEVLDQILDGDAAEKALSGWSRRSRYAGSKDRAAVRDHVFTALRCRRSHAALGGASTGRGLILGSLREAGIDPKSMFNGVGYGPVELSDEEGLTLRTPTSEAERLDIPDWLWAEFSASLGDDAEATATALRHRAPVHLRVNSKRSTVDQAIEDLQEDGIVCQRHAAADTALMVTEGARRIRNSEAYTSGVVELQDAASQAVVEALPLRDGMSVLDYCAGGGGKSLAMAARANLSLFAHDTAPRRMQDLPIRADRAGVNITLLEPQHLAGAGPFDLVLCDAPCSGSGSWRRSPEGKWLLDAVQLQELKETQSQILDKAANLVATGGVLAYATCSVIGSENASQVRNFLERSSEWELSSEHSWLVQNGTDGFYCAVLTRKSVDC